jgi:hypothetical protein
MRNVMKEEKLQADDAVDWSWVINAALKAERAHLNESFGEALGIYGDELLDKVESLIDERMKQLVSTITTQIALVMNECAKQKADVEMKMATLRKDLADDVVLLPNPLRNGKQNGKSNHKKPRPQ